MTQDNLVIVPITNGHADTHQVHIPAPAKRFGKDGQILLNFHHQFPPAHWPSLCGQISAGWVYNHAGLLQDAPVCFDCRIAQLLDEA